MVGTRSAYVSGYVLLANPLTDVSVRSAIVVARGCWNVPMACRDVCSQVGCLDQDETTAKGTLKWAVKLAGSHRDWEYRQKSVHGRSTRDRDERPVGHPPMDGVGPT